MLKIVKVEIGDVLWEQLTEYADNCSWIAGKHIAGMLRENRYFPWISSIFVDEKHRGNRVSQRMIEAVIDYAKLQGFKEVYIPSDMIGFYEKYGFYKIDELMNYGGDMDNIFVKEI